MTEPEPDVKWAHRAEFAEVAEVVGVTTDLIMAKHPVPNTRYVFVLFSYPHAPMNIYRCMLRRDSKGVLHKHSPPEEVPEMWEQLTGHIEAKLKRELGEPDA